MMSKSKVRVLPGNRHTTAPKNSMGAARHSDTGVKMAKAGGKMGMGTQTAGTKMSKMAKAM